LAEMHVYKKPVTTPEVIVIPPEDVEEPGIKAGEGDGQLNDAKADEAKADDDEDIGNAEGSVAEQNVTIEDVEDVAEDIPAIPATTPTVQARQTRSGRAVKQPTHLIEEMGAVVNDYKIELTKAGH